MCIEMLTNAAVMPKACAANIVHQTLCCTALLTMSLCIRHCAANSVDCVCQTETIACFIHLQEMSALCLLKIENDEVSFAEAISYFKIKLKQARAQCIVKL